MASSLTLHSPTGAEAETQTLKQLKINLKDALRKSGVLNSVKAQIRREFIVGLSDKLPSKTVAPANGLDLRERLSLSILYHFLQQRGMTHSLSVFAAECGLDSKLAWLSELDIVRSLQFGTQTDVFKQVSDKENKVITVNGPLSHGRNSIFDVLLNNLSSHTGKAATDNAAQTENSAHIRSPRESLNYQMENLKTSYLSRREAERATPAKSIEERMIQFQRECEERYRKDSESYLNYMRETEISKVRIEEGQRARIETDKIREELEKDYNRRVQEHSEREISSIKASSDRDRLIQQNQYECRQQMQREIDDLRGREKAGIRKLDLESQGLQSLDLRLKEVKNVLESREREVSRREKMAEDLLTDNIEKAKIEARSYMRAEIEELNLEKKNIRLEMQKLQDVKSSQNVLFESADSTRKMLRDMQGEFILKEDEIVVLQKQLHFLSQKLSKSKSEWDDYESDTETGNNESKRRLRASQRETTLLTERKHEKEVEFEKKMSELISQHEIESIKLQAAMDKNDSIVTSVKLENEKLKIALQSGRQSLQGSRLQNEEMAKIIKDQKNTIESLMRKSLNTSKSFSNSRALGVKTSMDDLSTFLASRKNRELSDPPISSSPYGIHHGSGSFSRSYTQGPGSAQQGAPPSADYSYNQFGERFPYRDPIVPVSDPLPSYKPVTLEAYRARESAQQEREQQQQQQSQQQLQQQHYQQQQQPQQQQQQQFNDRNSQPSSSSPYRQSDFNVRTDTLQGNGDGYLKGPAPVPISNPHRYYGSASEEFQTTATAMPRTSTDYYRGEDNSQRTRTAVSVNDNVSEKINVKRIDTETVIRLQEEEKTKKEIMRKAEIERQEMEIAEINAEQAAEREIIIRQERAAVQEQMKKNRLVEEQLIIAGVKHADEMKMQSERESQKEKDSQKEREIQRELDLEEEREREKKEMEKARDKKIIDDLMIEEEREKKEQEERRKEEQREIERREQSVREEQRIKEEKAESLKRAEREAATAAAASSSGRDEENDSKLKDNIKVKETSYMEEKNESVARTYEQKQESNQSVKRGEEGSIPKEHSLGPPVASLTPKNLPAKEHSFAYNDKNTIERDSLDQDHGRNRNTYVEEDSSEEYSRDKDNFNPKTDDDNSVRLPNVSTDWVSTIEHADEDSVGSSILVPSGRDQMDQKGGEGKRLFDTVLEVSTDSVWVRDGRIAVSDDTDEKDHNANKGKDKENEKEIGRSSNTHNKNDDSDDSNSDTDEDEMRDHKNTKTSEELKRDEEKKIELEKIKIAAELANKLLEEENEKKNADLKAIQDARASVVARRKQKSERDAVAASLSSLPPKGVEKVSTVSVSASAPNAFNSAKLVTQNSNQNSNQNQGQNQGRNQSQNQSRSESSSDESPDEEEKKANKSKIVTGLFDESLEIESVEESLEGSGDSSGNNSW